VAQRQIWWLSPFLSLRAMPILQEIFRKPRQILDTSRIEMGRAQAFSQERSIACVGIEIAIHSVPAGVSPMRPPCHDGVAIASGLLYWWPFTCDCQLSLNGVTCLGPAGDFDFTPDSTVTDETPEAYHSGVERVQGLCGATVAARLPGQRCDCRGKKRGRNRRRDTSRGPGSSEWHPALEPTASRLPSAMGLGCGPSGARDRDIDQWPGALHWRGVTVEPAARMAIVADGAVTVSSPHFVEDLNGPV
jgi:hypothetical protein